MHLAFLSILIPSASGAGTVVTTNTTWDTNHDMLNTTQVKAGIELKINAGTTVTVTGYSNLDVVGDLIAEGTVAEPIHFVSSGASSNTTGNYSWWEGIMLSGTGTAILRNVTINQAEIGVSIMREGVVLDNVTFNHSRIGVELSVGQTTITRTTCTSITQSCVSIRSGTEVTVDELDASDSAAAIVVDGGQVHASDITVQGGFTGIVLIDGATGDVQRMNLDGTGLVVSAGGTLSASPSTPTSPFTISDVMATNLGSGLNGHGFTGLELNDWDLGTTSAGGLVATDVGIFTVNDLRMTGSGGSAIDINGAGPWTLGNINATASGDGVRLDGAGTVSLSDSIIEATGDGLIARLATGGEWNVEDVTIIDSSVGVSAMAYSGGGNLSLNNVNVDTSVTGLRAAGDVNMSLSNGFVNATQEAGRLSNPSSAIDNATFTSGAHGVTVVLGDANLIDVSITGTSQTLPGSAGVGVDGGGHVDIQSSDIQLFRSGVEATRYSSIEGDDLTINQVSHTFHLDDSDVVIGSLTGTNSVVGFDLDGESSAQITNWTGSAYSAELALIEAGSTLTVRDGLPLAASTSSPAVDGEGVVEFGALSAPPGGTFGGSIVPSLLTETIIHITDQEGNDIASVPVTAHGFTEITDNEGNATLPISSGGSSVMVVGPETSATVIITSSDVEPTITLLSLPESGQTWMIGGAGPLEARLSQYVQHDALIEIMPDATLILEGGTIDLTGPTARIDVMDMGRLIGDNGVITGGQQNSIRLIGHTASIEGKGDGLDLYVTLDLTNGNSPPTATLQDVSFFDGLNARAGSDIVIIGGVFAPSDVALNGAGLAIQQTLTITAMNRGAPITDATAQMAISGGTTTAESADSEGIISFAEGRLQVAQGQNLHLGPTPTGSAQEGDVWFSIDTQDAWTHNNGQWVKRPSSATITATANGLTVPFTWDLTRSMTKEVIASSVPTSIAGVEVLEGGFSPYVMNQNTVITDTGELKLNPNVLVYAPTGVGLTANGVLSMDEARIQGMYGASDWAGITFGSTGSLSMTGGSLSGGTALLTLSAGSTLTVSDGLLTQSSGSIIDASSFESGNISLIRTTLQGGASACLDLSSTTSAAEVHMEDVSLEQCGTTAMSVASGSVMMTRVALENGASAGLAFTGTVEATVDDFDASQHDGIHPALRITGLGYSAGYFSANDVTLSTTGERAAEISNSEGINIGGLSIDVSSDDGVERVGLLVESSAMNINGMTVMGTENTTGVHFGENAFIDLRTRIQNLNVDHGNAVTGNFTESDSYNDAPEIVDSDLTGVEVVVDGAPIRFIGSTLSHINADSEHEMSVDLIDSTLTSSSVVDINGEAEVRLMRTLTIIVRGPNGIVVPTTVTGQSNDPVWSTQTYTEDGRADLEIVLYTITADGSLKDLLTDMTVSAMSDGYNTASLGIVVQPPTITEVWSFDLSLRGDAPPLLQITLPAINTGGTHTLNEGEDLNLEAQAFDDGEGDVLIEWSVMSGETEVSDAVGASVSLTGLSAGSYEVRVKASDEGGLFSEDYFILEVQASDNDGDQAGCPADGYSTVLNAYCGPDASDKDDDNDGVIDEDDDFPFDKCATRDTDGDGAPDEIIAACPTNLVVDTDANTATGGDTNDTSTTSDNERQASSSAADDDGSNAFLLLTLAGIAIGVVVIIILLRRDV